MRQPGIKYYIIENGKAGPKTTQLNGDGSIVVSDTSEQSLILRCVATIVSVWDVRDKIPTKISLDQNYPNPFNPSTLIKFDLPRPLFIELTVFDITGRKIATIAEGRYSAGSHEAVFDGSAYSSGVYIVRLIADGSVFSRKVVLIK